ncbi:hypothetical protein [Lacinutrix sp. Hel_I_90]|uniref:hypothetical protein n=1 Tax=Lacinutrix sp. Hel_I_90 TaxID=1249999 RepID=UPI0005C82BE7|nr:hypothetical protein [Lacinutrix sp. Hel_I_90]
MKNILYIIFFFTTSVMSSQEVKLVDFKSSNCDEEKEIKKTILSRDYEKNTFKIKIATIRNCCSSVSPEVNFKKKVSEEKYTIHRKY